MSKLMNVVLGIVLASAIASGCLSVHTKETKETPAHETIVVP